MKTNMTLTVDEYIDAVTSAYLDGFDTARSFSIMIDSGSMTLDEMDSDEARESIRKAIKAGLEKKEELRLAAEEVKSED